MGVLKAIAKNEYSTCEATIDVVTPKIVDSHWTNSKGEEIEKANLENTVFFCFETEGVAEGDVLKMQLFDEDTFCDDKKFAGEELVKQVRIQNKKGRIELELPLSWTDDLIDEKWLLLKVHYRKLYWKATYGSSLKNEKINSFLRIHFSNRSLYVQPSEIYPEFPEMYSVNGDLMMVVLASLRDEIHDKAAAELSKYVEKGIANYALAILEKGHLIDNQGVIHVPGESKYASEKGVQTVTVAANDGTVMSIRQGKKIVYTKEKITHTTVGISQIDHFKGKHIAAKIGIKGILRHSGLIWDAFDLRDFIANTDRNEALPLHLLLINYPVLGLAVEILGIIGHVKISEMDRAVDQYIHDQLQKAKRVGLNEVKLFISRLVPRGNLRYRIDYISGETASKLLQGEFDTFEDMTNFNSTMANDKEVAILIREQKRSDGEDIGVIETFFINNNL